MIFGVSILPIHLFLGGVLLALILAFQVLQGKRIIKFKGPLHSKVHRRMAWVLVAFAAVHAFIGMAYVFVWRIG